MRVFVYEYLCGAGAAGDPGSSLRAEGRAMLSAVLEDLGRCPGVRTLTLLEPPPGTEETSFRARARAADFSLVIAPECDGILEERCRWVEEEGGRLLGPSSTAVRLTADKLTLSQHLLAAGIPTPHTFGATPDGRPPLPYPLVCKPRFGAGSTATFLVHNWKELVSSRLEALGEGWSGEMVLQPFRPGLPVSVAFLAGPGRLVPLPAAEQRLSDDGRFRYLGGRLPLAGHLAERAVELATRAVQAVPGLHGYYGVDLVLAEDGGRDAVVEINPRLTTSYVGLRRLARFNLAAAMLAVASGAPPPDWTWGTGAVEFWADGRVRP